MKSRSIGLIIATILGAVGPALAAPNDNYHSEGDLVLIQAEDPATGSFEQYQVTNQKDSTKTQSTYLSAYKNVCDSAGCTGLIMYGLIPDADFSSAGNHAQLTTTVARTDDFEVSAWRFDFETQTSTELPPPSGLLEITWEKSGDVSETQHVDYVQTDENYTFRSNGQSTVHSATATGTCFGAPVPSSGAIGSSRSLALSISRNRP